MPEIIGDIVIPSELILPLVMSNEPTMSGALWISGTNLVYIDSGGNEVIL